MDRRDPNNEGASEARSRLCGTVLVGLLAAGLAGAIGGSALFCDDLRDVDGFVVSDGLWAQGHREQPHLSGKMFMEKIGLMQLLSSDASGRVLPVPTAEADIWPHLSSVREGANPLRVVGCPWGVLAMEQDRAVLYVVPPQGRIELTDLRPGAKTLGPAGDLRNGKPGAGPPAARETWDSLLSIQGLAVAFHPGTLREYRSAKRRLGPRRDDFLYLARPPGGKDDLSVLHDAAWMLRGEERLRVVTDDQDFAARAGQAGFATMPDTTVN